MYNRENQMISELRINNYKSLHDVTLNVGRFNVLIGENGCGKSNLLEAIAMVAAAEANKLDKGELESRGIRVTESKLMRSAFENENVEKDIQIHIAFKDADIEDVYTLNNDNKPYSKWNRLELELLLSELVNTWTEIDRKLISGLKLIKEAKEKKYDSNDYLEQQLYLKLSPMKNKVLGLGSFFFNRDEKMAEKYLEVSKNNNSNYNRMKSFIIFSPENTALRNFYKEGQIEPLGINGEGLFKLLKVISSNYPEQLEEINSCLQLFDWFDDFKIPSDSQFEDKITITDHYLTMDFDQRSANEGFLFVLFYIALMVSDDTPKKRANATPTPVI